MFKEIIKDLDFDKLTWGLENAKYGNIIKIIFINLFKKLFNFIFDTLAQKIINIRKHEITMNCRIIVNYNARYTWYVI